MRKRIIRAVVMAALIASVAACGTGPSTNSAASHVSVGTGTAQRNSGSLATGGPATSAPTGNVVVACYPPAVGNQLEIDTYAVSSGQLSTATFTYQSEQFSTDYGQVTWNPTDDDEIEAGNGDPCQGWQWNSLHTSIMGTVSITNGNAVPASVSIADNTLTLLAPVQKSNGFATAPQNNILDAVFGPGGSTWWLEEVPGSTIRVKLHHGNQTQQVTFPSDVNVQNGVTITFGADGAWALNAMAHNDADDPVWVTAQGISTAQTMPLGALPSFSIRSSALQKLLPQTQYYVGDGIYSEDRSQVAFFANLQGGPAQLFTVPASGGNPTQVTQGPNDFTSDPELIYFGSTLPSA